MSAPKTIAVHDGPFTADDCLSVYFLQQTSDFKDSTVVRTSDPSVISASDAACGVGGVHDPALHRYDPHSPDFSLTFTDSKIPLGSSGLVYIAYAPEIIETILGRYSLSAGEHLSIVQELFYFKRVREIDAAVHSVARFKEGAPRYEIHTSLWDRVAMLNLLGSFSDGVALVGAELETVLVKIVESQIPAYAIVKQAFDERFEIDPSGQLLVFAESCPAAAHISTLEEKGNVQEKVLFYTAPRWDGSWGIHTMRAGSGFELRKKLPFGGSRDEELSEKAGIPGGVFVHKSGFLGAFKTKDAAIAFMKMALAME
jgi:uncharacterized UPF0160 family protein